MCRGVATGGGGTGVMPTPPTSISEPIKEGSNSFSFKHQRFYFLWMFRNCTDLNFHDFYRACDNFWTISGGVSFFSNYIGEIDHFTFDLLKGLILNAGPSEKLFIANHLKKTHNKQGFKC